MQQRFLSQILLLARHASGTTIPDSSQATFSTQWNATLLATRLSSITTATTGQTTVGSGTQSDLLMMGVKMPETC